ncbi:hypothetical protein B0H67DRAFT_640014 [Lasiosphaeris hirsuta]|uniref:Uncharacterized protein n=1 Tax=Lasiosphaeris hirsuta TaxID=260670 RepID=A0AA40BCD0_9PEZI|nr:hypothetical protein B0H67DRAFT_640014 [Lasiosphaeris hirsuta]
MGGLIPLMLATGNRSSLAPPPVSHSRSLSTGSALMAKPKPMVKRLSYSAPSSLPVLPYTPAEWKRAISDVKRQHFSKRYRACAARCNEILDNIKDASQVEPIYTIYLHFYAATSMELCARTLPPISPARSSLFQQARAHFDCAATLIDAAEDSVVRKARTGSVSSRSSSCHSPAGSISSRAWTPDTHMSSPTNSVCSFEDLNAKTQQQSRLPPHSGKRVKKVSFSLPSDPPFRIPEPIVRPDSPTLGFDDDYFHSGPAARQYLPELPAPVKFQEIELPLQTVTESEQLQLIPEDDAFLMARSVDRYCENLSGLREQLARHSANLNQLIAAKEAQTTAALLIESAMSRPSTPSVDGEMDDLRKMDRQARIERLRKNGWQRKRFDGRRYEELCDAVMSELA